MAPRTRLTRLRSSTPPTFLRSQNLRYQRSPMATMVLFDRMGDLAETGRPIDMITMVEELARHKEVEAIGGVAYLSSLVDGLAERLSIAHYVRMVRQAAGARHIAHGTAAISELARKGATIPELRSHLAELDGIAAQYESDNSETNHVRGFDSVPDLLSLEITPLDYLVQGLIPTRSLTLWTGTDGTAKTFLAQNLAIAVSTGGKFLGSQCRKMPVLYLDYEKPDFVVRSRLELMGAKLTRYLKLWGMWLPAQPPQIGSQLLPAIAREVRPLLIFDPFRYAHTAEENDSTEMMQVMRDLRACVTVRRHGNHLSPSRKS
jgi:AAA domain/DnaB-like helicase N terminal domain